MPARHIVAIGGSDAGISAALRIRELDPGTDVTVVVGGVEDVEDVEDVEGVLGDVDTCGAGVGEHAHAGGGQVVGGAAGQVGPVGDLPGDVVRDTADGEVRVGVGGAPAELPYDALVVGTGAVSARPPIDGLTGPDALGPHDGVHLLHSMGDTFALMDSLTQRDPKTAVIIGAGYIGLEMAEALTLRGIQVTQIEALPEVLPTVDPELGALVHDELTATGWTFSPAPR